MFKNLLPLAILLPSAALAHKIPLQHAVTPDVLEAAKGDARKAYQYDRICSASRIKREDCAPFVEGDGSLIYRKAVDTCTDKLATAPKIDPKYGHEDEGVWHPEYRASDKGRLHYHKFTQEQMDMMTREYTNILLLQAREEKANAQGNISKTTTVEGSIGVSGEVSAAVATGGASGGVGGSQSTTKELPKLTQTEIDKIKAGAKAAVEGDPFLLGKKPNLVCYADEKNCSGTTKVIPNTRYNPKLQKDYEQKLKEEKSDKETSSTSGLSTEGKGAIEIISTTVWAGEPYHGNSPENSSSPDKPSPLFENGGEKWVEMAKPSHIHPIEECIWNEYGRLKKKQDELHTEGEEKDPNEAKAKAQADLKLGICNSQVLGTAFCQKFYKDLSLKKDPTPVDVTPDWMKNPDDYTTYEDDKYAPTEKEKPLKF